MATLKAIKTDPSLAPRPQKGIVQGCYDALDALAGPSRLDQIIKLLPASDLEPEQYIDADRLKGVMQSGKSWGYFTFDPDTQKWWIAPRSYYVARQEYLHDPDRERGRRPRGKKKPQKEIQVVKVTDWKYTIVLSIVAFVVGFGLGMSRPASADDFELEPQWGQSCPIAKPFRPLNCPRGWAECICTADGCFWIWRCP